MAAPCWFIAINLLPLCNQLSMKRIGIFLFSLFAASGYAQISVTSSMMPVSGDTIRYSTVTPGALNLHLNETDTNHSWDYSSLSSSGQDIYEYLASNKTPYAFYFTNKIGLKTADSIGVSTFIFRNIYSFYTKNSSVFKNDGVGYSISGIPLSAKYSDPDEVYQFPLSYGDSDVSTFNFRFTIPTQNSFAYVQQGVRTNIADGWGSIKTPYKNYPKVLRVRTIVDEIDSIVTQFGTFPVPRKQVIYRWFSEDEHIPVLEITGTMAGSVFTASQIRYRDAYNGKQSAFKPIASFTLNKTSGVVNTDTFDLTNRSLLATSYTWQFTPANSAFAFVSGTSASSRNARVVFTKTGLYSAILVARNTFGTDDTTLTDAITITDPNAAVHMVAGKVLNLYPNPAGSEVYVTGLPASASISLCNAGGQVLMTRKAGEGRIDLNGFAPGFYLLKYESGAESGSMKFIHQ